MKAAARQPSPAGPARAAALAPQALPRRRSGWRDRWRRRSRPGCRSRAAPARRRSHFAPAPARGDALDWRSSLPTRAGKTSARDSGGRPCRPRDWPRRLAASAGAIVAHDLELEAPGRLVVADHLDQVRLLLITEVDAILAKHRPPPALGSTATTTRGYRKKSGAAAVRCSERPSGISTCLAQRSRARATRRCLDLAQPAPRRETD